MSRFPEFQTPGFNPSSRVYYLAFQKCIQHKHTKPGCQGQTSRFSPAGQGNRIWLGFTASGGICRQS